MASSVTFLHAADLHLGAPFRGLRALSDAWADRLLKAIPEAYDRVVETALRRKVDFVVIAGDVFDTSHASYADYRHFFDGLCRLGSANIPVYLCTGNHDPYTSWRQDFFALPENATMFSAEHPSFALYEREGQPLCVLGGRGYYNQAWSVDEDIARGITRGDAERELGGRASAAPFGVGVLHTGLDLDPAKAPTNPSNLLGAGFDYWALGHIHKRCVFPEDNPRMSFSGCIQGRDIKETGERGVNIVTLEQGKPNVVEFVPTASVVWQRMEVDVSACSNLAEIEEQVIVNLFRENGRAHCEEMCTSIVLCGRTSLHSVLARPGVMEDLRSSINASYSTFFCDALIDKTRPVRDVQALRGEGLFPAVLLRVAEAQRACPDDAIAYLQEEFLEKNFQPPKSYAKRIGDLMEEAELLVLDLLDGGEGE